MPETPDPAAPPGEPEELPELRVEPGFAEDVTFITRTHTSLLLGLGQAGEEPADTLVPYLDIRLRGRRAGTEATEEDVDTPLFSMVLTVEMAAFLLADLATDFREACLRLERASGAGLRPEPVRLRHSAWLAAAAGEALAGAGEVLRRAAAAPPAAEEEAPHGLSAARRRSPAAGRRPRSP